MTDFQACAQLEADDLPDVSTIELQRRFNRFLEARPRPGRRPSPSFSHVAVDVNDFLDRLDWTKRAIDSEFDELYDHLPWKSWKDPDVPLDASLDELPDDRYLELVYEVIDIQHFVNNLYLSLGLEDEDVRRIYLAKHRENMNRQTDGRYTSGETS